MKVRYEIKKESGGTEAFTGSMSLMQSYVWERRWRKFWENRGFKFKRIEEKTVAKVLGKQGDSSLSE